ncbi:squalene cyclase [Caldalkalibacillus uzonensis]|uniref:Squalene cyclase n=1 Tax=Caldalkalibacillus uzonensis TaxID=353224 RepID=A0ABU0CUZ8_9BACI|nr:squalene cyclase [Caldalkalibacillus uzonensis]
MQHAIQWLLDNQEADGSWYGRWGICYIYGTWAALTGLMAAGVNSEHPAVQEAVRWLTSIQLEDGGWGESCRSDQVKTFVALPKSTISQTAWAVDALTAVHENPTSAIDRGVHALIKLNQDDWALTYPTGGGLPGSFYVYYHSYRYFWPLLALSHYRNKYL